MYSPVSVCAIFRKVPNFFITLLARSMALEPLVPVRKRIARSSELLRAFGPFLTNFSLGLSSIGQFFMLLSLISPAIISYVLSGRFPYGFSTVDRFEDL